MNYHHHQQTTTSNVCFVLFIFRGSQEKEKKNLKNSWFASTRVSYLMMMIVESKPARQKGTFRMEIKFFLFFLSFFLDISFVHPSVRLFYLVIFFATDDTGFACVCGYLYEDNTVDSLFFFFFASCLILDK